MQFSRPNWSWSFEVIKIRVWRQNNWYYATVIKPCCFFFFFRCLNSTALAFLHKQCRPVCGCCVDSALCFHLCLWGFFLFFFFKAWLLRSPYWPQEHTHTRDDTPYWAHLADMNEHWRRWCYFLYPGSSYQVDWRFHPDELTFTQTHYRYYKA